MIQKYPYTGDLWPLKLHHFLDPESNSFMEPEITRMVQFLEPLIARKWLFLEPEIAKMVDIHFWGHNGAVYGAVNCQQG